MLSNVLWVLALAVATWMTLQAAAAAQRFADRPFDFDEAVHALPAYQIAVDLRAGDLGAALAHSFDEDRLAAYPFLHSWLIAPALMVSGADTASARLANTVFVWVSLALAAWVARALSRGPARDVAAPLAALLLALSLPVWVYANTVLLEGAGLVVTLAWLGAYLRARPGAWPGWAWLAGLLSVAAFFTKYSFGVFVVGGMALAEALALAAERRPAPRRWLALFAPAALLIGGWLLLPDKLGRLAGYSVAQRSSLVFWSWANWLYAPVNSLRFYASGPLAAGLMAATIGLLPLRWRDEGVRKTCAAYLAGLAALTWVPQKDARFLYTVAPLLIPAAAALAAQALPVLRARRWLTYLATGVALLELSFGVVRLSRYAEALQTVFNTSPDTRALYAYIIDHSLAPGQRPRLLNTWFQVNALAASWEYYARYGGRPAADDYNLVHQSQTDAADETARAALFDGLRAAEDQVLITIDGSPAGAVTGWAIAEPALAEGDLLPIDQSPTYTLFVWPRETQERLFAAEIGTVGEPITYTVRLNVYEVK